MKLYNKNVLVYGLGKSGIACVDFLSKFNANVFVYDDNLNHKLKFKNFIDLDFDFQKIDLVVISPAVYQGEVLDRLKQLNKPIISEIQLAYEFFKGKIIAVTGTNGKTTTVSLIGKIFEEAGFDCVVCGNIGLPLISLYEGDYKDRVYILEVSSFQLEYSTTFKPFVSCILNIAPDHLNRHKNMENYSNIKFSICKNQSEENYCILNKNLKHDFEKHKSFAKGLFFGSGADCCEKDGKVFFQNEYVMPKSSIHLLGEKNLENVLASVAVAKLFKIENKIIKQAIDSFNAIEHRIEFVDSVNGVIYINDSKATNVASTLCALECFKNQRVILLVGGIGKKEDYSKIFEYSNLKLVICYGKAREEIFECGKKCEFPNLTKQNNLKESLEMSFNNASAGDVVLLSPACASFDEFENFEKRGEYFKGFVNEKK